MRYIAIALAGLILLIAFLFFGDEDLDEIAIHGSGPVDGIVSGSAKVSGWQSYCALPVMSHVWSYSDRRSYNIEVVAGPKNFEPGSSYLFVSNGELRHLDLATGRQWSIDGGEINDPDSCRKFISSNNVKFSIEQSSVIACKSEVSCKAIEIASGTWVYAYAEKGKNVIALTNYGDALLYSDDKWCRMSKKNEVFLCNSDEPMLLSPRAQQFYSSVEFEGETLVGEWPTGRLYVFDGETLELWQSQPPIVSSERVGYEAQSMANYCGDLFVGYWPRGEIWRLDHLTREWSLSVKLFHESTESTSFIPYLDRDSDQFDAAYFGQRVTALIPFKDSLYVATSNLRGWDSTAATPVLSAEQRAQYGRIYKINQPGCHTTYLN